MKKRIFTGAATALVTPFGADGRVNFERLKTLVNEQIDGGIDALVICGTTGEKSTLRYDEHLRVIEEAAKAANGTDMSVNNTARETAALLLCFMDQSPPPHFHINIIQ